MTIEEIESADCAALIFKGIAGSRAYGMATETSDTDYRGVFVMPMQEYLRFGKAEEQVSDARNNRVYYSLRRFLELAMDANPSILELLYLPEDCVIKKTASAAPLLENRHLFISKRAADSHIQYALSQIRKAKGQNKRINNPQAVELPREEDFCSVIPAGGENRPVPLNETAIHLTNCRVAGVTGFTNLYRLYDYGRETGGVFRNGMLVAESLPEDERRKFFAGYFTFNKAAFEEAKRKHAQYWEWIRNRNDARWTKQESGELDYDAKNMMHVFRLLLSGLNILRNGEPLVRVRGKDKEFLLDVKGGKFSYEELIEKSERIMGEVNETARTSVLPDAPDTERINGLLLKITKDWEAANG